jgi:hypothetical protein
METTHTISGLVTESRPAALCAVIAASALWATLLTALTGCVPRADAGAGDAERAKVEVAVQRYFKGHSTGDGAVIAQAFHPAAHVLSAKDGKLADLTLDQFKARFPGKPAADEAKRVRRILSVDISGDAAVAKVELSYPDNHFIDYLSLLKLDGSWVIVNKIFHRAAPK